MVQESRISHQIIAEYPPKQQLNVHEFSSDLPLNPVINSTPLDYTYGIELG